MAKKKKPWAGRFREPTERLVEEFTSSIGFDRKLASHDIAGSVAHARMLKKVGLLTAGEARKIETGLKAIEREIEQGKFVFDPADEDIHMAVEARLIEKIGPVGGKLHAARSRNDQVATALRLYLREAVDEMVSGIEALQLALAKKAKAHLKTVMPGYTHLQRAQPVSLAHHLMAHWEALERDRARLADCRGRINVLPLGAAALAGTSLPIDRRLVARELGFASVAANSLDAVSDRDFVVEFLATSALAMTHLSRIAEELILWCSAEFGFARLPDALCTGSSLMPHKKNPDAPELVRAKTGRVIGDLVSLLTVLKALPLAYNRDLQEDKEPAFDAAETLSACLAVTARCIEGLEVDKVRMAEAAGADFPAAVELVDRLVEAGVPMREAHGIVGRLVRSCVEKGVGLADLDPKELARHHRALASVKPEELSAEASLAAKRSTGSAAPAEVARQVRRALRRAKR
ncbi:argininosuccinate lyase [Nitrospinae bacterium AH-259-F20]|nr:argininosuccinate lyase [Nitrospinae bacterium AH-259-F20]